MNVLIFTEQTILSNMLIFSKNHKRIVLEIILLIATAITNFYLFELLKCEPLFPQNVIKIAQRKLISAKHISFKQVCRRLLYVLLRQHWFLFRKSLWNSIYARQKFNLWHYTRQWHIFTQNCLKCQCISQRRWNICKKVNFIKNVDQ